MLRKCDRKHTANANAFFLHTQDSVTAVVVHHSDIIACSVDGTVRRFDMRMGRMYVDELHHPVTSCAISHDGQCLLAACLDSTLRLLDRCVYARVGVFLCVYVRCVCADFLLTRFHDSIRTPAFCSSHFFMSAGRPGSCLHHTEATCTSPSKWMPASLPQTRMLWAARRLVRVACCALIVVSCISTAHVLPAPLLSVHVPLIAFYLCLSSALFACALEPDNARPFCPLQEKCCTGTWWRATWSRSLKRIQAWCVRYRCTLKAVTC